MEFVVDGVSVMVQVMAVGAARGGTVKVDCSGFGDGELTEEKRLRLRDVFLCVCGFTWVFGFAGVCV